MRLLSTNTTRTILAILLILAFAGRASAQKSLFPQGVGGPGGFGAGQTPHVTWQVSVTPGELSRGGKGTIIAKYKTAPTWHLYAPDHKSAVGKPTRLATDDVDIQLAGSPVFPTPKEHKDTAFNEIHRLLDGEGEIRQNFTLSREAVPGERTFNVLLDYMACTDELCDPPTEAEPYPVKITVGEAMAPVEESEPAPVNDEDEPLNPLIFILTMIGGGLFTLVMPCTYPMIPITISFFTKQADARGGNVLPLSLAYGAGIVLVFNIVGWLFAGTIGPFAANKFVNLIFAIVFFLFGLSLLGLFTLRLPGFLNNVASRAQGSSGYVGVFLLGMTVVVTSFTCTAPVLGPLLFSASKGGDMGRVTLGMTSFGLTMAIPFVLLSLFPARIASMPRAGEWMHTLKVSLGFVEIAAALKFLSLADVAGNLEWFPRELFLIAWTGIFGVWGLYLLGMFHLRDEPTHGVSSFRLTSALFVVLAAMYFFYGALGYKLDWVSEILAPPYSAARAGNGLGPGGFADGGRGHGARPGVSWTLVEDDFERGLDVARREGKVAFINITGKT
jgi:thiol:disulfide interchange protein DsbD